MTFFNSSMDFRFGPVLKLLIAISWWSSHGVTSIRRPYRTANETNTVPGLLAQISLEQSNIRYPGGRLGSQVQTVACSHLAKPVPNWRKYIWRVKDSWKALFYIQVWNNYWSDDWEFGEISTGFEVENSLSWWAVDDGESGVVIRVAKDPSCPGCRNHASWMQQGPASRWDHRDASQGGMGQNSLHNWLNLLQKRHTSEYPLD